MTEYDNTNRFTLFRNEDRKTDKHPEFSGTLNVDGREFWVSAWVKEGKKGKFFSGSVKAKDSLPPKKPTSAHFDDDAEGIPF